MNEIILDLEELQTRADALRRQFAQEHEGWADHGDIDDQVYSAWDINVLDIDEEESDADISGVVSRKASMDIRERKWTAAKLLRPLKYGVVPDMEEFSKEEVDEINREYLKMTADYRNEWQVVDCPKTQARQLKLSRKFVQNALFRNLR